MLRHQATLEAVAGALVGLTAAVVVVLAARETPHVDPGVRACQMMNEDRSAGRGVTDERSRVEIDAMARSDSRDLRDAARLLLSNDLEALGQAMPLLYSGCADVGVRLS